MENREEWSENFAQVILTSEIIGMKSLGKGDDEI